MDENAKKIIDEFGINQVSGGEDEKMRMEMIEAILKRVFLETMKKLDDSGRMEYEKMVGEKSNPDQLEEFLKSKIKNYDEMVQRVVEEFKNEMKQDIG